METKLLSNSENDLNIAAEIIRSGGTVVFPTETVYGLGADALNPDAVKKYLRQKAGRLTIRLLFIFMMLSS